LYQGKFVPALEGGSREAVADVFEMVVLLCLFVGKKKV
jgi:hypothetical protein